MNLALAIILTAFATLCGLAGTAGLILGMDTPQSAITLVNAACAGIMSSWFWIDWKRGV